MKMLILATAAASSLVFGFVASVKPKQESPMPWVQTPDMTRILSTPIYQIFAVNTPYHYDASRGLTDETATEILNRAVKEAIAAYEGDMFYGDRRPLENFIKERLLSDTSLRNQGIIVETSYIVN